MIGAPSGWRQVHPPLTIQLYLAKIPEFESDRAKMYRRVCSRLKGKEHIPFTCATGVLCSVDDLMPA
jgi:hypothetical protein